MAKPPIDADPEKFIIGKGAYTNFQTACAYFDGKCFRIDPAAMPTRLILITNLIFIAFFYGFHWAVRHLTHGEAGPFAIYGAPLGIGALTCLGFTGFIFFSFDSARRLGPWLVYDKVTGKVDIPRQKMSFKRSEIVHLQYITTKRLDRDGGGDNDQLSELNLITCRDGVRTRWPLLRSIFNIRAFDALLKPLLFNTDLQVVRVQDGWWGWKVTETPYGERGSDQTVA